MGAVPIKAIKERRNCAERILLILSIGSMMNGSAKQAQVPEYEKQIDQLVYKFYGLTDEEIETIE